jgi:hypothetical protein
MTAVEWLEEHIIIGLTYDQQLLFEATFEQAKEMEKEQIIEAHGNKQKTKSNPNSIVTYGYTYTGEMYYNDKYKNTNQ